MIIQFLLPMAGLTGGVKVVYQYANYLHDQGHTVRIIYPGKLFPPKTSRWRLEAYARELKYSLQAARGKSEAHWFPLKVPLIRTPSLEERYIPAADITIATSNETADWVTILPKRCGDLFYFIQAYEHWSRPVADVDATWTYPLKKIVIASWLKRIAEEKFGQPVCGMVINGIDSTEFYNTNKIWNTPPRILLLSHPDNSKGVSDGLTAFKIIQAEFPDVQLSMFGTQAPRADMPSGTDYHQLPTREDLRSLYCSSDIYISPSIIEGGPLPPMEAMACACAVVTTRVGAVPDYTIPGKTTLVVPTHHPELLAEAAIALLKDNHLLQQISLAGQRHIQQFTVQKAAHNFEKILLENFQKPLPPPKNINVMPGLPAV